MNLNIPGINKKKTNSPKKSLPKINLSKGNLNIKMKIYIENIISFFSGKLLLHELIRLNKKVIGILFAIGLISSSAYSVVTNYDTFNKKIKQEEINKRNFKMWTDKKRTVDLKYNKLQNQYSNKIRGTYSLSAINMERDLIQLYISKINKNAKSYVTLQLEQIKEDIASNTIQIQIKVMFKRQIMRPFLVSTLLEDGYFIETLTDTKLKIRKLKE